MPSKGLQEICCFEMYPRATCGSQAAGWEDSYRPSAAGDGHCCWQCSSLAKGFVALLERTSAKYRILKGMKRNYTAWCKAIIDILDSVLGAFRKKLWNANYLRHVCLSVCLPAWNSRGQWADCLAIWYLNVYRKCVKKFQVSLKSDNDNGTVRYCTCRPIYITVLYMQTDIHNGTVHADWYT